MYGEANHPRSSRLPKNGYSSTATQGSRNQQNSHMKFRAFAIHDYLRSRAAACGNVSSFLVFGARALMVCFCRWVEGTRTYKALSYTVSVLMPQPPEAHYFMLWARSLRSELHITILGLETCKRSPPFTFATWGSGM